MIWEGDEGEVPREKEEEEEEEEEEKEREMSDEMLLRIEEAI
jgi:hypothetical protein